MNVDLQDLLARRADTVEPPTYDPLAVVARGEQHIRRRNRITAVGAALVLAVTMGVTALVLDRSSDQAAPANRPDRDGLTWTPGTRPVTYGQEQILHLGTREIDTGLDFLSVAVTDDGAALTTIDGEIWFTDGRTVERIGSTLPGRVRPDGVGWLAGRPRDWVVTDTAGSLMAWLEYPGQRSDRPELVVFDSGSRAVLDRQTIEVPDGGSGSVLAVADRGVFVAEDSRGFLELGSVRRYDVDTGVFEPVDTADVAAARRAVSPALVVGPSAEDGRLLHWEGDRGTTNSVDTLTVDDDSQLDELVDPHTGEDVEIRVPAGYDSSRQWFVQWVDDDRFTLIAGNPAPVGDLLVCRITEGRCDVLLDDSTWTTEPLLPGHGGVGADLALKRAMRSALETRNGG